MALDWRKDPARFAAVLFALCVPAACSMPRENRGTPVAHRIVSLIPSLTEDLCAIGAGGSLVGVSQYSQDIPCARRKPVVSGFASLDAERVVELRPDAIVGIPAQRRLTATLTGNIPEYFLSDDSFADIFRDITRLGTLAGRQANARALERRLRRRTGELRASERFRYRPRVFVVLGTGPIWTVGPASYLSTLIGLAGGRNAVALLPGAYAQYSAEALVALQPDALVSDESIHLDAVLTREPWRSLRAVVNHRVYIIKDAALLERPGPRYNEGLAWLIDRLRPIAN